MQTMTKRPVLFISHDASRTGAPIHLLNFLRWLKASTNIKFEIVLAADGELRSDFEKLGRVSVLEVWRPGWRPSVLAGRARRRRLLARLIAQGWGAVYSNTITNGHILEALNAGGRPMICHVHELEMTIRRYGRQNLDAVRRQTCRYIACAEAVKANLVDRHQIDPELIDVIHGFVELQNRADVSPDARRGVLAALGIPVDSLVVGASGTTDWRKGPDLFIQLARAVHQKRPALPVYFIWIGGAQPGTYRFEELQHDIRTIQMEGRIHFVGPRANPLAYFATFDVFALVSREDPFPLVCLEAASLGKPIVCFDGAGGAKEFVEEDCGFVVPYLDLDAMADRVLMLLELENLRQRCGHRAAEKVRSRHDVKVAAPEVLRVIERYL
jgi:glycosyltransferase involved in cell wall biosynthesis